MIEYMSKFMIVWAVAFLPVSELFIAIPTGFALGLDSTSILVSTITGNILPILLIHFGFQQMMRIESVQRWLMRLATPKVQGLATRYGLWLILVGTPLVGVWAIGITAELTAINRRNVFLTALVSICIYSLGVTFAAVYGVEAISSLFGAG